LHLADKSNLFEEKLCKISINGWLVSLRITLHLEEIQSGDCCIASICLSVCTGMQSEYLCDTEVNLCYSNPCHANGTCMQTEGGYICLCNPGVTGTTSLQSFLHRRHPFACSDTGVYYCSR